MNKVYKINIQTLTPVHIGAGQEKDLVEGADFIRHEKKLHFLNTRKISEDYGVEMLCNAFMNPSSDGLRRRLEEQGDFKDYIKKSYPFESNVPLRNGIKSQIKNPVTGNPLIPGSSLKGAIRSLLFAALRSRGEKEEDKVLGSLDHNDDFLRFIQVSDCSMNQLAYLNTKTFNLKQQSEEHFIGAWKHGEKSNGQFNEKGFNFVYECISVDSQGVSTIGLNPKLFKKVCSYNTPYYSEKDKLLSGEIKSLFNLINQQTENYIDREIAFFEQYSNNETPRIIDELIKIKGLLMQSKDDFCVLRMSAGSGFHSITGDWQFDTHEINGVDTRKKPFRGTYDGKHSAKSRKIAIENGHFYPMGFVMLSLASDEEYNELLNRERDSINVKMADIKQKEEVERRKREEEKRKRAEQEKKLKIHELLIQFDDLFEFGKFDEAKAMLHEVYLIDSEDSQLSEKQNRLNEAIRIENEVRTLTIELEELKTSDNLASAIELIEKLKVIDISNIQHWNNELQEIQHRLKVDKVKSGGLSELREKLNGKDIDVLSKRYITQYIKATGKIPSTDIGQLYEILMDCYAVEKRNLNKWHGESAQDPVYWKRIKGWLKNEDDVNILFERFQKEQNL
ncbi:MAG: RAMP superfamily CRISPR-associated protein [Candidatus Cloacimonadaceae bacterium]|nr:RAMP superfamily CRISPR-associated protein [Bacteroidales bacterium]